MTQRMFVCHAKSDVEATSELIEALENALELPATTLVASSLPGYASNVRGEGELHAMLTGATVLLALFTESGVEDPEFAFELGAAWALGIDVVPLLLGSSSSVDVPWPLRDRSCVRAHDPLAWNELVEQLSHRLQVKLRDEPEPAGSPSAAEAPRDSALEPQPTAAGDALPPAAASVAAAAGTPAEEAPAAVPGPAAGNPTFARAAAELAADSKETVPGYVSAPRLSRASPGSGGTREPADATAYVTAFEVDAEPEPAYLAAFEAEPVSDTDAETDGARAVSIVAPVMVAGYVPPLPRGAPVLPNRFEPASDVRASLPSYRMSLEAGRALSECMFNREESADFVKELEEPFGRFVDAVGGSWGALREQPDFDGWIRATEALLQNLPAEGKRIGAWYELGYELATLHNLAGQGLFDTDERRAEAERMWRRALERFLSRAENAAIPYEDLGRVLSLLENLVAPRTERDLGNIGRSLEELRRQAAGADQQHTAA